MKMILKNTYIKKIHIMFIFLLLIGCSSNIMEPVKLDTFTIRFSIPDTSNIRVYIEDSYNNLLKTLIKDIKPPGYYSIEWDLKDDGGNIVCEGIYFYVIKVQSLDEGKYYFHRKVVVLSNG